MNALIIVDVQNDFLPGGALAVADGDQVIPVINALQPQFELVVATQDWHPADHASFATNHAGRRVGELIDLDGLPQVMWPNHCVQNTRGADFGAALSSSRIETIFRKGTDRSIDSYSGFFDNGHRKRTGLGGYLKDRGVSDVHVCGLATDYCVKFTVLDARELGFNVHLHERACRGVNLKPGDVDAAIRQMRTAGAVVV